MTKIPENLNPPSRGEHRESHEPKDVGSEKGDKKFQRPDKKHKGPDMDKDARIHPDRPNPKPFTPDSKHPKPLDPKDTEASFDPKHPHKPVDPKQPEKPNDKPDFANSKEKKVKPDKKEEDKEEKKKEKISESQVNYIQPGTTDVKSQTPEVKEIKGADIPQPDAAKAVSQIREVVIRMVSTLRTGAIGEMPVHQMDLKTTSDVPSFLQGASVMITREAPGKISVSISNLSAPNMDKAIKAMETQTAQLQQLMNDLAQRQLAITDLRVGEHSIALPRLEAPPPTPFAAATEGYDRRRDESGGGRGGEKGKDQEKGDREKR